MVLNDSDMERIDSYVAGKMINSDISIEDQIAAIRETLAHVLEDLNIVPTDKFVAFQDIVSKRKEDVESRSKLSRRVYKME